MAAAKCSMVGSRFTEAQARAEFELSGDMLKELTAREVTS